jgi:FKBP-type peptidyl-prolyl cis-trans isomerase (trigger factor)
VEEAKKNLEARATRQVQATLLMEKIAQLEKIEVTDKEVQERVDALARAASEQGKALREFYARPDARDELRAQLVFARASRMSICQFPRLMNRPKKARMVFVIKGFASI